MIPEGPGAGLRIPPHSEEAECGVLGSILLDPVGSIDKCLAKRLGSGAFYDRRHQALFEQMVDMSQANVPMDAITIAEWLKDHNALDKAGGYDYLVKLQDSTLVPAHVEFYCDIVLDKKLYRELIEKSSETIDAAYKCEDEASLLVSQAESSLFELGSHGAEKIPDWKASVKEAFIEIENRDPNDVMKGVTTGYMGMNSVLGGLAKTDMIVLAARPAMGKTSLALNIAENAALGVHGPAVPVAVFSLEMSREQLVNRMLFSHAKISAHKLRGRKMTSSEHAQITAAVDRLSKAEIFIDDTPGLEAVELRSRARRLKTRYGVGLIVIDYLQLMNFSKFAKDGRQRETMAISGAVKAMAKELDVPVMVLSQLSRATEGRGDNIPKLSDLRDSGAIEQDADVVMLLYRPSYYKQGDDRNTDNLAVVDIAKFRHGSTGEIKMNFIREYTRFEDRTEREDDEYSPGA
ncbi:replicative DNA helicase [Pontiella sulfatireligans]|uniref:Replicative DNA helicase n=1 Tax=Pontiella sulfatireligans TaxID=2750658 RepID=A0A6C2ULN6_9BACT|nr:replicative DNA helicase [Pontiella sulfatireligans]VGO20337.1 Replicative DNA helicase [Pontiella sulfatireligans]